jgi:hypothetical protein
MWTVRGIMDYIVSADGANLRRDYVWKICPMLNVDGVVNGNTRSDSIGRDLNREWNKASGECAKEVTALREAMIKSHIQNGIDLIIDFHGSGGDIPYLVVPLTETLSEEYIRKQNLLIQSFQKNTDYKRIEQGEDNSLSEGVYSNDDPTRLRSSTLPGVFRFTYGIVSVTTEIKFTYDLKFYLSEGVKCAKAIDSYFKTI